MPNFLVPPALTLTRQPGGMVEIDLTYRVRFVFIERQMTKLGMIFVERVDILGVDPPGGTTGTPLKTIVSTLAVSNGDDIGVPTAIILPRHFIFNMTRASLDEDKIPNVSPELDPDEIRARVEIRSLVPSFLGFSDQEVLGFAQPPAIEELEAAEAITEEVQTVEVDLSR